MSASSKKKLRKEQNAAALTEKQQKQLTEAKQLKRYTVTFVVAMVLVVAVLVGVFVRPQVNSALNKGTHALTVNGQEISAVELNYYYIDAVSNLYNQYKTDYGDYANMYAMFGIGLNFSDPMSTQIYDKETGDTWADYFINLAISNVKNVYGLYAKAKADPDFKLEDADQNNIDTNLEVLELTASMQGYKNLDKYLCATYGEGATAETFQKYYEMNRVAEAYFAAYYDGLEYEDSDYREYEKDKYHNYSNFTYGEYLIQVSDYLPSKEADSNGNISYTKEERDAAIAAAQADRDTLLNANIDSIEDFNKAINKLTINKDHKNDKGEVEEVTCNELKNVLYSNVTETKVKEWLSDDKRTKNEFGAIEITTKVENADGKEGDDVVTGYYMVLFQDCRDNTDPTVNVRHLLVAFKGGKTDSLGNTTYTDEEKATAETKARELMKQWKDGEKTVESFIELVKNNTDDAATKADGGLIEKIYPEAEIVESFRNWSLDEKRKVGDIDIVESVYGFHVMYFDGFDEMSYRDIMIDNDMRAEDSEEWYDEQVKDTNVEIITTSRVNIDYYVNIA